MAFLRQFSIRQRLLLNAITVAVSMLIMLALLLFDLRPKKLARKEFV